MIANAMFWCTKGQRDDNNCPAGKLQFFFSLLRISCWETEENSFVYASKHEESEALGVEMSRILFNVQFSWHV